MQKKYWTILGVILMLAAFVAIFITAYRAVHSPPPVLPKPQTHVVLAVDVNDNNQITQEDLAQGKDAILAVRASTREGKMHSFFSSFKGLVALDTNKDNHIDKQDSTFSRMELVFLAEGGKKRKYVSLDEAGIEGVILNKEKIDSKALNTGRPFVAATGDIAGHVLLKDGKTRLIRFVKVDAKE